MSKWRVVFFSRCQGCGKTENYNYPLSEEKLLDKYHLVEGSVITKNVTTFIKGRISPIVCECNKCYGENKVVTPRAGVIIRDKFDPIEKIFGKNRDELGKSAKRLRLSKEWEDELYSNPEYKCLKCQKPFLQPLPLEEKDLKKVCLECQD